VITGQAKALQGRNMKRAIKPKLDLHEVLELVKRQMDCCGSDDGPVVRPIGASEADFKNALGFFGLGALTTGAA
jgi:hypothetical protein